MNHIFPTNEAIQQLLGICANVDATERMAITDAMDQIDRCLAAFDLADPNPTQRFPGVTIYKTQNEFPDAPSSRLTIDAEPMQADFDIINYRNHNGGRIYTIHIINYRHTGSF